MKKVLVTGATGLVGTAIANELSAKGYHVTGLSRNPQPSSSRISWMKGDLKDFHSLEKAVEGSDIVVHCAAIISFGNNSVQEMHEVNVQGTESVVNLCLNYGASLVHVSSVAALGRPTDSEYVDEKAKWEESPHNTQYAIAKHKGEMEVWRGVAEGLNAIIINPSVILGTGDWTTSSLQIYKYVYDQKRFYTKGTVNYVDIRDVAEATVGLIQLGCWGERFVLNGGHTTYENLLSKMAIEMKVKPPTKELTPLLGAIGWRVAKGTVLAHRQETFHDQRDSAGFQGISYL